MPAGEINEMDGNREDLRKCQFGENPRTSKKSIRLVEDREIERFNVTYDAESLYMLFLLHV